MTYCIFAVYFLCWYRSTILCSEGLSVALFLSRLMAITLEFKLSFIPPPSLLISSFDTSFGAPSRTGLAFAELEGIYVDVLYTLRLYLFLFCIFFSSFYSMPTFGVACADPALSWALLVFGVCSTLCGLDVFGERPASYCLAPLLWDCTAVSTT